MDIYGNGSCTYTGNEFVIGRHGGSSGVITVSGAESSLTVSYYSNTNVGFDGDGVLTIENGGQVNAKNVYIDIREPGAAPGSGSGRVTVDGVDSKLLTGSNNYIHVGNDSNGILEVKNSGYVSTKGVNVGLMDGYGRVRIKSGGQISSNWGDIRHGEVAVDGNDSKWTMESYIIVGDSNEAGLEITNGGAVICNDSASANNYIGFGSSDGNGVVDVDGNDSFFMTDYILHIGYSGADGELRITGGADVNTNNCYMADDDAGDVAKVVVDGNSSTWTLNQGLRMGYAGKATMEIKNEGLVSIGSVYGLRIYGSSTDNFINMKTGGRLALEGAAADSLEDFLNLISGSDAINYWNDANSTWDSITEATRDIEYTLEYQKEGELKGYTILTVYAPDCLFEPDIDKDGDVDFEDYSVLADHWQESGCADSNWCDGGDTDHSGEVDSKDLEAFMDRWLEGVELPDPCIVDPCGMVWVDINDPGVSGHEGFKGKMSKYETTNGQYAEFLTAALASGDIYVDSNTVYGADGNNTGGDFVDQLYYYVFPEPFARWPIYYDDANGVFSVGTRDCNDMSDHPVTRVNWYGARAFANYYGYNLPTEWEWLAVADYDGTYSYGCGTDIDPNKANYDKDNPLELSEYPYTTPVSYYETGGRPGPFGYGLCDLAGNAWEWTDSWETSAEERRVLCGGSWIGSESWCAFPSRFSTDPNGMGDHMGFRVCR